MSKKPQPSGLDYRDHPMSKLARAIKRRISRGLNANQSVKVRIVSRHKGEVQFNDFISNDPVDLSVFFRENPMSNVIGIRTKERTHIFKIDDESSRIAAIEVHHINGGKEKMSYRYIQTTTGEFVGGH